MFPFQGPTVFQFRPQIVTQASLNAPSGPQLLPCGSAFDNTTENIRKTVGTIFEAEAKVVFLALEEEIPLHSGVDPNWSDGCSHRRDLFILIRIQYRPSAATKSGFRIWRLLTREAYFTGAVTSPEASKPWQSLNLGRNVTGTERVGRGS